MGVNVKSMWVYKVRLEGSATGDKPRVVHLRVDNQAELHKCLNEYFNDETVVEFMPYPLSDPSTKVSKLLDGVYYEILAENKVIQQGDSVNDTEIFIKHGDWVECYIRGYDFDSFEWKHVFHIKDFIKIASEQGDLDLEDFQYEELDLHKLENLSSIVFEYLASGIELDGKVEKVARSINENPITPIDFKFADMVEREEYTIYSKGGTDKAYTTFMKDRDKVLVTLDGTGYQAKKMYELDVKSSISKLQAINVRSEDFNLENETIAELEGLFWSMVALGYGGVVENPSYTQFVKKV
ncbi:hypothetical protein [Bacillus toyonensis]|uniref:hypothetical protein n=1 Tax=Bacillus toyonensis TaxID=155322 RepID=UPI00211D4698|nr:hypothetical protein [Bacillus toyonensis]